jgi:hypothetical protein
MTDELVQEFCQDAKAILAELSPIIESLEFHSPVSGQLEAYGQKVDRIMGAAKSLGYESIGSISELCKAVSYKASQSKDPHLVRIVTGVLAEATEGLTILVETLEASGSEPGKDPQVIALHSRLNFLQTKLADIQRSSVAVSDPELAKISDTMAQLNKSK